METILTFFDTTGHEQRVVFNTYEEAKEFASNFKCLYSGFVLYVTQSGLVLTF